MLNSRRILRAHAKMNSILKTIEEKCQKHAKNMKKIHKSMENINSQFKRLGDVEHFAALVKNSIDSGCLQIN
jgi:hypothetical protein